MSDITSWLREQAANDFTCEAKLIEAADEIERLKAITWAQAGEIDRLAAENDRLTNNVAALQNRLYLNNLPHALSEENNEQ